MKNIMRLMWIILVAVGLASGTDGLEAASIPYPTALDAAAVSQPAITNLQRNG